MDRLEQKNLELENKLHDRSVASSSASLTHSSPKKSHSCAKQCTKQKCISGKHASQNLSSHDSHDESCMYNSRPSKQLRHQLSDTSMSSSSQFSVDFLKTDDMVQRKVHKQLEKLQG